MTVSPEQNHIASNILLHQLLWTAQSVLHHLQAATQRSIVALDELGRGTATTDGAAIAAAVLEHLSTSVCCRCVNSLGKPVLAVLRAYEYVI